MKETAWLFLLPVYKKGQNPENRHVMDLAFGVYKLESAGISRDNIFIAIDGADYIKISEIIEQFTGSKHKIYSTDEIETLRSDATFCSNLVLLLQFTCRLQSYQEEKVFRFRLYGTPVQ